MKKMLNNEYDINFYKNQYKNNLRSAEKIIKIILDYVNMVDKRNISVVDLGCGSGNWLSIFEKHGCEILGIDGNNAQKYLKISRDKFYEFNLKEKLNLNRKFTLATSFEVAEHIEPECADIFIDSLTNLSDIIFFSAAIPFQRGAHHVNEQWPTYWIEKFEKRGYSVIDCVREQIWNDSEIRGFYAQNIFLFCKNTEKNKPLLELRCNNRESMYNLVHPFTWTELNTYKFMRVVDKFHQNKIISYIYTKFFKK